MCEFYGRDVFYFLGPSQVSLTTSAGTNPVSVWKQSLSGDFSSSCGSQSTNLVAFELLGVMKLIEYLGHASASLGLSLFDK